MIRLNPPSSPSKRALCTLIKYELGWPRSPDASNTAITFSTAWK